MTRYNDSDMQKSITKRAVTTVQLDRHTDPAQQDRSRTMSEDCDILGRCRGRMTNAGDRMVETLSAVAPP